MAAEAREGRSLTETPTWAVATVITFMVTFGFFFQSSLNRCGKWLNRTKRKPLLAALLKIKEELMLFGLLSLLMGHWIVFVARICVKSSAISSRFYPCAKEDHLRSVEHILASASDHLNNTMVREHQKNGLHNYCSKGQESFASHESLEQLHRLVFVLGITHVSYSFFAIVLAMIKIYSWRHWETEAKSMAVPGLQDTPRATPDDTRMRRLSTFVVHHTAHPWSRRRVFVWLLCFGRQFWSSISPADYMALRLGFITSCQILSLEGYWCSISWIILCPIFLVPIPIFGCTNVIVHIKKVNNAEIIHLPVILFLQTHQLPLSYDFHNYMVRSMEEEFRDIVGINVPLWIYAILCIFLDFHGSNIYFWLSFLPAILILLMGTKMHRVVIKLAVEIMDKCPLEGFHQFNLRDELFWFGKPKLLLSIIHLISFQNAIEMATFLWSLWEIKEPSCSIENRIFLVVRLSFGIISQFWCSFITFPLYVVISQMGSRFRKSVISESVRKSLTRWHTRVKARHGPEGSYGSSVALLSATASTRMDSVADETDRDDDSASDTLEGSSSRDHDTSFSYQSASMSEKQVRDVSNNNVKFEIPLSSGPDYDIYADDDGNSDDTNHR